jgi:hypothetical protein
MNTVNSNASGNTGIYTNRNPFKHQYELSTNNALRNNVEKSVQYNVKDLLSFQFTGKEISTKLSVTAKEKVSILSDTVDKFKYKL